MNTSVNTLTKVVRALSRSQLVKIYLVKKLFTSIDEWLFYFTLIYLWRRKYPKWMIILTAIYGGLGVITGYKNLEIIESKIGIHSWLLYPLTCK